jgi:hypothetical protein
MSHHEYGRRSRLVVFGLQHAAIPRGHTKEFTCAGRYVCSVKQLDAFFLFVEPEIIGGRNDPVKHVILLGKFQKFIRCVCLASAFLGSGSIVNPQKHLASGTLIREGCEEHVVDHAENCGGGADAQSQRADTDRCECTASSQAARRVAQVAAEILWLPLPFQSQYAPHHAGNPLPIRGLNLLLTPRRDGVKLGALRLLSETKCSQWLALAQASVFPPFTEKRCPVMKRAASLARKATSLATSSGMPIRFIGTVAA